MTVSPPAKKWQPRVMGLLVFLVTGVVFLGVTRAGFVAWDDDIHVYENPYFSPVTAAHLQYLWLHPYQALYIPVSYTVYAALASVSRLPPTPASAHDLSLLFNPHTFHWASLLIHCTNALLVFVLLRRLVRNESAAGVGALLFSLHPVQVESVAWVAELRGTLCGLFSLLALWLYLCYADGAGASPVRGRVCLSLASVAFVLALLCKPSAVAVPLMAWTLAHLAFRPAAPRSSLPLLLWGLAAVVMILVTRSVQYVPPEIRTLLWERPFIAGDALAFYLLKLFIPVQLTPDYGRTPVFVLAHAWGYWAGLIPVALAVLVWRLRKPLPWLVAAGGLSVAWLLPVLGLIPFAFQRFSTVADRYLYLALLGPALGLAFLLSGSRSRILWGGSVIVLGLCAWQSAGQVRYWQDSAALFGHVLAVNPHSWNALDRLGEGQDNAGNKQAAAAYYRQSLALEPDNAYTENNLGKVLTDQGKLADAAALLGDATRRQPGLAEAHDTLGQTLYLQGKSEQAIVQYEIGLRLQPNAAPVWNNLGVALQQQKRFGEAYACYNRSLAINPSFPDARYDLGNLLEAEGNTDGAIGCYRQVLEVDPENPDANFNLGALLCQQGRMTEAVQVLTTFLQMRPNDPPAHYYMGVAQATLGNMPEAMAQLQETLRLDPKFSDARRVIAMIKSRSRHR